MKLTVGSHSTSVNYCHILMYFRVTNHKVKAALIVLSGQGLGITPNATLT